MKPDSKLVLVITLAVGCLGGAAASEVVVPKARSADVQRWEYHCVSAQTGVTAMANKMGAQGWELAASAGAIDGMGGAYSPVMIWCFKRPL